nr:hypothetical protein ECU08_1760 [Encephalitozoon cuniculi]
MVFYGSSMGDEGAYSGEGLESRSTEMLLSILEYYDTGFIEECIIDEYGRRMGSDRSDEEMAQDSWHPGDSEKDSSFQEKEKGSEPSELHLCNFIDSYGTAGEDDSSREEKSKLSTSTKDGEYCGDHPSHFSPSQSSAIDLSGLGNLMDPTSFEKALELERRSVQREELVRDAESEKRIIEAFHSIPEVTFRENLFDKVKINKVYVESNIQIKKQNGRESREQKRVIRGETSGGREKEAKTIILNDYVAKWESVSESSSDIAAREKAFKVIKEAEKRATGRDLLCNGDLQLRKFVVDQEERYLRIEEVIKLNDLKYKNLVGKIYKKGKNGKYQYNWFTLKKNFFTCYGGKENKITSDNLPSERDGDLRDPENGAFFFKKKYTIDLLNAGVYLVKQPFWLGCIRWGSESDEDLIDITESTKIIRITPVKNYFMVSLKKNLVRTEIRMDTLDFALKSNGETHFYRSKDIDSFLGWVVAFAFRQGKVKCNIG